MDKKWLYPLGWAFCLTAGVLSVVLGAAELPLSSLLGAFQNGAVDTAGYILFYSRLPRTAGCLLSGAALACAGYILQSVLGSSLASPHIIGVNAGAGLAVTLCCALGLLSGWMVTISAFFGAMAAAAFVYLLARKTGASRSTLILSGVAMNSILTALTEALTTLVPETAMLSGDFRVGSMASISIPQLVPAGCLILLGLLLALTMGSELEVLALGDDTAQSLGLPVKKARGIFLLLSALLSGASVSFAGLLGFVGLIVPHALRAMGAKRQQLLGLCALYGAGFVTVCDLAARCIARPYELSVGILMSLLGGPFFLGLLLKKRGGRRDHP